MRICLEDTKVVLDKEREEAIWDKGYKEGLVIGMEEGIRMRRQENFGICNEEGKLEIKRETVIRCFKRGLDIDIIAKGTRLSEADVKAIIDEYSK